MPITKRGLKFAKQVAKRKISSKPPKRLMRSMAINIADRIPDMIYDELWVNRVVEDECQNLLDLVNEELASMYL